jgi:hypothetical protein
MQMYRDLKATVMAKYKLKELMQWDLVIKYTT